MTPLALLFLAKFKMIYTIHYWWKKKNLFKSLLMGMLINTPTFELSK